jgi:hydrogenase maturation protease
MATSESTAKTVVLGLGNELLADDAIGILAARELAPLLEDRADVIATSEHGVALLDLLMGYESVVVIDAIVTGRHPIGSVFEIDLHKLRPATSPSPHYVGLGDLVDLAKRLGVPFPDDIRIIAVEVADPHTIGGPVTPAVEQAMPELIERARQASDQRTCEPQARTTRG